MNLCIKGLGGESREDRVLRSNSAYILASRRIQGMKKLLV